MEAILGISRYNFLNISVWIVLPQDEGFYDDFFTCPRVSFKTPFFQGILFFHGKIN
jgi:hypothetical protein